MWEYFTAMKEEVLWLWWNSKCFLNGSFLIQWLTFPIQNLESKIPQSKLGPIKGPTSRLFVRLLMSQWLKHAQTVLIILIIWNSSAIPCWCLGIQDVIPGNPKGIRSLHFNIVIWVLPENRAPHSIRWLWIVFTHIYVMAWNIPTTMARPMTALVHQAVGSTVTRSPRESTTMWSKQRCSGVSSGVDYSQPKGALPHTTSINQPWLGNVNHIKIPCLSHVCWNMLELLELFYVLNPNAMFSQWKYGGFSHPYYGSMFPSDDIYIVLGKGYPFLLGWFIAGCRATSKGKHRKLSPWGPRPLYLRWLKQFEYRWNTPTNRCEKALIWKSRVLGASLQLDMRPFLDCMCSGHGRLLQLRVPSGNQTWQWQWTIAYNCLLMDDFPSYKIP